MKKKINDNKLNFMECMYGTVTVVPTACTYVSMISARRRREESPTTVRL